MSTRSRANGRRLTSIVFSEDDEKVHGTDFGEIVFRTIKPQILCISLESSLFLRKNSRRVVDSQFVGSGTWARRMNA